METLKINLSLRGRGSSLGTIMVHFEEYPYQRSEGFKSTSGSEKIFYEKKKFDEL